MAGFLANVVPRWDAAIPLACASACLEVEVFDSISPTVEAVPCALPGSIANPRWLSPPIEHLNSDSGALAVGSDGNLVPGPWSVPARRVAAVGDLEPT